MKFVECAVSACSTSRHRSSAKLLRRRLRKSEARRCVILTRTSNFVRRSRVDCTQRIVARHVLEVLTKLASPSACTRHHVITFQSILIASRRLIRPRFSRSSVSRFRLRSVSAREAHQDYEIAFRRRFFFHHLVAVPNLHEIIFLSLRALIPRA